MSFSGSFLDVLYNAPPPNPASIFPGLTGSILTPPSTSDPNNTRPRLSSPRLFRHIFSSERSGSDARTLPPGEGGDPAQLAATIDSASRAVETAQEAFGSFGRMAGRSEVVDLTSSPPNGPTGGDAPSGNPNLHRSTRSLSTSGADSDYLSSTLHPQDHNRRQPLRSRRSHHLNEPIFGYQALDPTFIRDPSPDPRPDSLARVRAARRAQAIAHRQQHHIPRRRNAEQEEREAVLRQQDNHAAWQRTQARTRLLQTQRADSPATSALSEDAESTPSSPSFIMSKAKSRAQSVATAKSGSPVEQVDLKTVDNDAAVESALAKLREDAIFAQRPAHATEAGRTPLTAYKCPVCMEVPINATTTICGHLFCHECIMNTLNWSAKQRNEQGNLPHSTKNKGSCPVCRKLLLIKDASGQGRTLIPLEIKFIARKRKTTHDPKGKGKTKAIEEEPAETSRRKRVKRETREDTGDQMFNDMINSESLA